MSSVLRLCSCSISASTLDSKTPEISWAGDVQFEAGPPKKDPEASYPDNHKIVIKNLLLGWEAKADEYNVVECTYQSKPSFPIAVLKVGETRSEQPQLEFGGAPLSFKLVKGAGPVHIHCLYLIEPDEEDEMEMMNEFDEGVRICTFTLIISGFSFSFLFLHLFIIRRRKLPTRKLKQRRRRHRRRRQNWLPTTAKPLQRRPPNQPRARKSKSRKVLISKFYYHIHYTLIQTFWNYYIL